MTDEKQVYYGSRGNDFRELIINILKRGNLKDEYIDILTNRDGMTEYGKAFTAVTANSDDNMEILEQLGDLSANKFIVTYVYKRFPQINCTEGLKIAARLRIVYGSKATFAPISEKLGFWSFISAAHEGSKETGRDKRMKYRNTHKKELLEDTLEAFIGCTETLLDNHYRIGVGYAIVYDILSSIFDELNISIKFQDLYDSITRLKETFDKFKSIGTWYYIHTREPIGTEGFTQSITTVYLIPPNVNDKPYEIKDMNTHKVIEKKPRDGWEVLGSGVASNQDESSQKAAEQGIETLKSYGYYREPPEIYQRLCR